MPTLEILPADEAALKVPDNRMFVPAAFREGRFKVLTPIQRIVLGLCYLGNTELTDGEVGQLLEPPRSAASVKRIRREGIYQLDHFEHIKTYKVDSLHLSTWTRNAVLGNFGDIPIDELAQKVEGESEYLLQHAHRFGRRTLQELRDKLATYQPQAV